MGKVKTKGNFVFNHSTTELKSLLCMTKGRTLIEVDFNDLEVTPQGTVLIHTKNRKTVKDTKRDFVTINQILPYYKEDEKYFDQMSQEIKKISNQRKRDVEEKRKERRNKRKEIIYQKSA